MNVDGYYFNSLYELPALVNILTDARFGTAILNILKTSNHFSLKSQIG